MSDYLRDNWERFAGKLEDYAIDKGINYVDAYELGQKYGNAFQDLYERYDMKVDEFAGLSKGEAEDMLYDEWYEIYDQILDDYDIDIHDSDFYSKE